jgi:hypothetical protein
MEKDFEILSFRMLKDIAENHRRAGVIYSPDEFILERLRSLASFFETNDLATRKLLDASGEISEEFVLRSTDLTELGMKVLRKGYDGWMRNSKKRPPNDVSAMTKALKSEA